MRTITKEMIGMYNIDNLKYDFMGYTFNNLNELSFHHLIIPHRECKKAGIGDGYVLWNGAILKQKTSHDYLHFIETIDRKIFLQITKEMIEENLKGKLDIENLKRIRELLLYFESKYKEEKPLILKRKYTTQRINL